MLIFPAFRLRGHYVSIATLAIGQIVGLVILNWDSLTRGAMGLTGIPPLSFGGHDLYSARSVYWICLGALVVLALLQTRLLSSHLGRTLRAIRDDDVAARAYGVRPTATRPRLRVRRFRRGRQRRALRASLLLHQLPDF